MAALLLSHPGRRGARRSELATLACQRPGAQTAPASLSRTKSEHRPDVKPYRGSGLAEDHSSESVSGGIGSVQPAADLGCELVGVAGLEHVGEEELGVLLVSWL
jgi:hypothetical protein